jgi:hypothetical protein
MPLRAVSYLRLITQTFVIHIATILFVPAQKEVSRVAAQFDIAVMADEQIARNRAIGFFPSEPVHRAFFIV